MKTPFFLLRPLLPVAAATLLMAGAGCQSNPPPASPTPAPTKDANDYKGSMKSNGPHPAKARPRLPMGKSNGPHPAASAPTPTPTPPM